MSDNDGGSAPPAISYTRKRTLTKTRTAATKARRRKNIPLCHASGGGGGGDADGGGKDQHSWFARKSAGWTDAEIKSHLVSGGTSEGGKSFAMVGDVILGDQNNESQSQSKKGKKRKGKRVGGPRFAWEEDEAGADDGDDDDYHQEDGGGGYNTGMGMVAAPAPPTLADIMDEQDKLDFMSPVNASQQYQMQVKQSTGNDGDEQNESSNKTKSKSHRQKNAALAELAQVSGVDHGITSKPTSANESIGWRLLRVLGYRSRLGVAFVPLSGYSGGKDGGNNIDNEVLMELEREGNKRASHEAKWLASKRLRAIRLPSIQNNVDSSTSSNSTIQTKKDGKGKSESKVLAIPPPKINRHGIGFDPFKNAPEFRAFHEQRRALARKQGRGIAAEDATAEGEDGGTGRRKGDRYFTDNLRKNDRQALWDKKSTRKHNGEDNDSNDDDDGGYTSKSKNGSQQEHSHYAADRDYSDFIGTKASSGFALQDEDDANVYQDEEMGHPRGIRGHGDDGEGTSQYAMEVQSPVASEEEDNDEMIHGGLFGKSALIGRSGRTVAAAGRTNNKSENDKGKIADAWSAWGMGAGSDGAAGGVVKKTTMDGKPPLVGFALGQSKFASNVGARTKPDAPARWKGPTPPTGYVLKRHVFQVKDEDNATKASEVDNRLDSGLGLDLQRRRQQGPSRSFVPKVLPPSSGKRKLSSTSGKMVAKDGSELDFHAVRESMKSRFVTSAGPTDAKESAASEKEDGNNSNGQDLDKEEWVEVTVTPWIPTRLLCKRWGVSAPTTAGLSPAEGARMQNKEEDYFRQTVYEPAIQRQKDERGKNNGAKETTSTKNDQQTGGRAILPDMSSDDGDISPPPTRPSAAVFQSIFDAESDMDISSSEDDDSSERVEKDSSDMVSMHVAVQPKKDMENAAENRPAETDSKNEGMAVTDAKIHPPDQMNDNGASSVDGSVSSGSLSSGQRRKRRRRHRRSEVDSEDSHDGRMKRKKKEKHRSKRRHRGREYSASESDDDESERGHASDNDGRRRKKKKRHKHHRSHSRHKRRKNKA